MHGSLSKDRHLFRLRAKVLLKRNNKVNSLNITLYYSLSLNICECLRRQIYQYNCNQLKSQTLFSFKNTSIISVALNPSDILPKEKLIFFC